MWYFFDTNYKVEGSTCEKYIENLEEAKNYSTSECGDIKFQRDDVNHNKINVTQDGKQWAPFINK